MKSDIAGVQKVIGEVFLDYIALVSAADDEVVDAVVAIDLKDVPEDRLTADFNHRLRPKVGFLRQTRAKAAGQDHGLHARWNSGIDCGH